MKNDSVGTKRRTLLQRALAVVAGGVAVVAGPRLVRAERPADPARRASTLTLYARSRPAPGVDARRVTSGDLLDGPDGAPIGDFYTNCFCRETPFGPQIADASNLEFQVLRLPDGTIFGMGSGHADDDMKAHAVIGGTGRFAGTSGSYVERPAPSGEPGVVELLVTFAS